jgi:hypothetical protein
MDREHDAADKAKGNVKETTGKLTDDKKLQSEGKLDKAKGRRPQCRGRRERRSPQFEQIAAFNRQILLICYVVGNLNRPDVSHGHAEVFGLAARVAFLHMAEAEQAGWQLSMALRATSALGLIRSQLE